ncbi:hypothetical protein ANN_26614 [Periplaneta americana]|uniref:Tc1-like transposase DDE domain-containing protein n=1 Tax=Periplaneta americana TaxID=6978 RepID=A0ABQ8RYV5_PERAM|nr:hypothetical protein ANN_26614 [Periplaneta americana]
MSYDGVGLLDRIHCRFLADVYEHILANVMIPSARERYPEGTLFFQQDNHPVHTINRIQKWFTRRPDVDLVDWPPKSPDMNRIENLLATVKRILRSNWAEQPPVRTADEEEVAMNLNLFRNLVDSMPRRMRAVVDAVYYSFLQLHYNYIFRRDIDVAQSADPVRRARRLGFDSRRRREFLTLNNKG